MYRIVPPAHHAWIVLIAGFLTGCGGAPTGDVVSTVKASGVLKHQGQPLEYHQVVLIPEDNRPAAGVSDDQGRFVLGTNTDGDGAVVGSHRVTVVYVGPPSDNPAEGITEFTPPPEPRVKIDSKYANAQTTDVTVEVPPGGTDELVIELE